MPKCEWCGENYTDGLWDEHFYIINIFGKYDHIICKCCIEHLTRYDLKKREVSNAENN